ncbi:MAG: toxin-antitoxin system YwqK family antitoxin [Bacteroidales bacterium]|jgi:antitoxin component YwqK of YwqJK toxin-antitoxin module
MKNFKFFPNLFLLILVTLLFSCKNDSSKSDEVIERFEDGTPMVVREYKNDNNTKYLETRYYPNSQKQCEGNYEDGKKEGYWEVWYENGNSWSQGNFKNGLSEGKRVLYYENGQVYIEGNYKQGQRVGTWVFYDTTGAVIKTIDY